MINIQTVDLLNKEAKEAIKDQYFSVCVKRLTNEVWYINLINLGQPWKAQFKCCTFFGVEQTSNFKHQHD